MKKRDFWEQVNQRVRENQQISSSGMPNTFANVMEWVGLKFVIVGGGLSLVISSVLWLVKYDEIVRFVRVIVWR